MIEEVKKMVALQKEFARLYNNSDLGFIAVVDWGVQVTQETFYNLPGIAREYTRNCNTYPYGAEKYFEDVRFFTVYSKHIKED